MDSVSIELWLDKRQLAALEQALTEDGTTVERTMQEQLNELYAQRVPLEQQEKIQQALDAERLESQRNAEASARYAGLHITENGQEHYLSTKSGQEFLDMAILMRRYVRGTFGDKEKGFARCIYGVEEISPQRFEQLAAWRLENFGKVTGLVEIDFDKGLLSALNIMDGWQSFRLKDVSSAAYFADKSGHVNKEVRWNIFLSRLEGKQLTSHTLDEGDIHDAVIFAMNELFQTQVARNAVKASISAVLAGEEQTLSLPAVELQIRNLQERQLELFQLIVSAGADCTDYDEELRQVNMAKTKLMAKKAELEKEQRGATAFEERLAELDVELEQSCGALTDFDELTVRQLVSNIKVLDKDSLLICFKDGTEITQAMQRRQTA